MNIIIATTMTFPVISIVSYSPNELSTMVGVGPMFKIVGFERRV